MERQRVFQEEAAEAAARAAAEAKKDKLTLKREEQEKILAAKQAEAEGRAVVALATFMKAQSDADAAAKADGAARQQQRADAANAARVERMAPQRKSYIQPRASFVPPSSPPPLALVREPARAQGGGLIPLRGTSVSWAGARRGLPPPLSARPRVVRVCARTAWARRRKVRRSWRLTMMTRRWAWRLTDNRHTTR